jgi:hypothetical protein
VNSVRSVIEKSLRNPSEQMHRPPILRASDASVRFPSCRWTISVEFSKGTHVVMECAFVRLWGQTQSRFQAM